MSVMHAEQLQTYCPGALIKDIQGFVGIELELVASNGTQFPYISWSTVNFEIGEGSSNYCQSRFLFSLQPYHWTAK